MLWVFIRPLEAPRQGASNEYPQHRFSRRNKKNSMWQYSLLFGATDCVSHSFKVDIATSFDIATLLYLKILLFFFIFICFYMHVFVFHGESADSSKCH